MIRNQYNQVQHLTKNTTWESDKNTNMSVFLRPMGDVSGPSPPIKKWTGSGSHRVPKAREGGEHERGNYSPSCKGGGFGGLPRENF